MLLDILFIVYPAVELPVSGEAGTGQGHLTHAASDAMFVP